MKKGDGKPKMKSLPWAKVPALGIKSTTSLSPTSALKIQSVTLKDEITVVIPGRNNFNGPIRAAERIPRKTVLLPKDRDQ